MTSRGIGDTGKVGSSGRFCLSVSFHNGTGSDYPQEVKDISGNRCRSSDHDPNPSPENTLGLVEDQTVIKGMGELAVVLVIVEFLVETTVDNHLLITAHLFELALDEVIEAVVEFGHRGKDSRSKGLHVLLQFGDIPSEHPDSGPGQ